MKYIRTKDGIYEYVDYDNECIIPMPIIKYNGRLTHCAECDIIKQADTIEELCDEFIDIDNHDYYKIAHDHGVTFALSKTRRFIGHYDIRLKEIGQIMGAIWTDKGLIYVSKMKGVLPNGKIDWELL